MNIMNKINKINKLNKILYCIRHGQAQHNVNYLTYGSQTFYDSKYIDTRLTFVGISESIELRNTWSDLNKIELVITSPLFRALQTTTNLFKNRLLNVPILSLECVREFPNSKQTCNKRSNKSELKRIFPYINFENLKSEAFRETFIGMTFQHPNIVRTLGCVYDQKPSAKSNGNLMIIMGYMKYGSLHQFVQTNHSYLTKADRI